LKKLRKKKPHFFGFKNVGKNTKIAKIGVFSVFATLRAFLKIWKTYFFDDFFCLGALKNVKK